MRKPTLAEQAAEMSVNYRSSKVASALPQMLDAIEHAASSGERGLSFVEPDWKMRAAFCKAFEELGFRSKDNWRLTEPTAGSSIDQFTIFWEPKQS